MCEDYNGNNAGEYVVKFKGGTETGVTGMASELVASLLADELDLACPTPAVVDINPNIADLLSAKDSDVAEIIKKSGGLNFGSRVLSGGFGTWPVNKSIPNSLTQLAAEIFTFDALIQNPDRRTNNPNLLWKGSEIYIIDHELAFSFVFEIGTSGRPWELKGLTGDFLNGHVFSKDLKGKVIDLSRLQSGLEGIDDLTLRAMFDQIPIEWNNDNLSRIREHLRDVRNHSAQFIEQVKWRLV